ncbi:MAG: signal peptidase II [Clostridia bacterium]|nr:signal peptidase II [Clostridia bacterium]
MEKEEGKSLVKKEKKINKEMILWISIVVSIILIDQIGKIWIQHTGEISIIPQVLSFKVSQNTDAAYGIGSNSTFMYVATNLVILSVIFKFITTQNQFVDKKLKIFLSFILAGGIANVIDRVLNGYVTEFINIVGLPVLNLADIFVLIGWMAVAAIFASFTVKEWRKKEN